MSTIVFNGYCGSCKKQPIEFGKLVLKRPAVEGQGGHNIEVWCTDCVREYYFTKKKKK